VKQFLKDFASLSTELYIINDPFLKELEGKQKIKASTILVILF
jgi:hypothetical protein